MSINIVSELLEKDSRYLQEHQSNIVLDMANLKLQRLSGKLDRPWSSSIQVRANQMSIVLNLKGSLLIRDLQHLRQYLAPEQSVVFIKGPALVPQDLSRGPYDHYIFTWNSSLTMGLSRWIEARAAKIEKKPPEVPVYIGSGTMPPIIRIQERMIKACSSYTDIAEPIVLGGLHEMVIFALTAKNDINLTSLPSDIPAYLKLLLKRVKKNPEQSWSLKEASTLAGYSPFHLSRTFKASIGYGFPEFVDRCRIERAVQFLLSGGHSIDRVATVCGYSSTHGSREAMKEYIGFLPSELRAYAQVSTEQEPDRISA